VSCALALEQVFDLVGYKDERIRKIFLKPIGSSRPLRVTVRVIVAAKGNPEERFRAEGGRYGVQDPGSPGPSGEDRSRAA